MRSSYARNKDPRDTSTMMRISLPLWVVEALEQMDAPGKPADHIRRAIIEHYNLVKK